jgi:ketosteroid isomerase-like protein
MIGKMETTITGPSADETAIRALEDNFVSAFNAGDVNSIMKNYLPDSSLVVFDVVPRKRYRGADAYREDWVEFFSHFASTPKIELHDLGVTADGDVGFGHSFQHVTGIDKKGHPVDRWVRVTGGYRKVGGKWLIALEHISVPVNLATGKASLEVKP